MTSPIQRNIEDVFSKFFGVKLYPQKVKVSEGLLELIPNGITQSFSLSWDFDKGEVSGILNEEGKTPVPFSQTYHPLDDVESKDVAQGVLAWLDETYEYRKSQEFTCQSLIRTNPNFTNEDLPFYVDSHKKVSAPEIHTPRFYGSAVLPPCVDLDEVERFCNQKISEHNIEGRAVVKRLPESVELHYPQFETYFQATREGEFIIESENPEKYPMPNGFGVGFIAPISTQNINRVFGEWFAREKDFCSYHKS